MVKATNFGEENITANDNMLLLKSLKEDIIPKIVKLINNKYLRYKRIREHYSKFENDIMDEKLIRINYSEICSYLNKTSRELSKI